MRRFVTPIAALVGVGRRSELAAAVAVGLVLAVATTVLVAQPRLLRRAETESLDQALAATPPQWLGLALDMPDLFAFTGEGEPTAPVTDAFDELAETVPARLSSLYGDGRYVIDTTRFAVPEVDAEPAPSPIMMTLRLHPDLGDRVEFVAGAPPQPIDEMTDDRMAVMEIAVSAATAETLGLDVGSELTMGVSDDALLRRIEGPLPPPFLARVSGVFEPTPATDPYWWGDLRLHRPIVNDTNAGAEYIAYGMFQPEQLATAPFVVDGTTRLQVQQRRELVPGAVDIDNSDDILQALRTGVTAGDVGRLGVATGLGQVLINSAERRQTAQTTTLLAIVGMVGATLATCVQFLRVSAVRRRSWLALARARGAGTTSVVVAAAIEMTVVAALAGAVGLLAGALAGGGGLSPRPAEIRLAVVLGLGAVLATSLIVAGEARRFGVEPSARSRRWRVLGIGLVLVAGVASVMAYLREGVPAGRPVEQHPGHTSPHTRPARRGGGRWTGRTGGGGPVHPDRARVGSGPAGGVATGGQRRRCPLRARAGGDHRAHRHRAGPDRRSRAHRRHRRGRLAAGGCPDAGGHPGPRGGDRHRRSRLGDDGAVGGERGAGGVTGDRHHGRSDQPRRAVPRVAHRRLGGRPAPPRPLRCRPGAGGGGEPARRPAGRGGRHIRRNGGSGRHHVPRGGDPSGDAGAHRGLAARRPQRAARRVRTRTPHRHALPRCRPHGRRRHRRSRLGRRRRDARPRRGRCPPPPTTRWWLRSAGPTSAPGCWRWR